MHISNDTYAIESVTSGHPDKVCDQISDAILDACLSQDKNSRVAVETFGGHNLLVIGGEVTTNAKVDYEAIGRKVYKDIGYEDKLDVVVRIAQQSRDIGQGVDVGGAGDQGIMYGYATSATKDFLPYGYGIVNELTHGLQNLRESGKLPFLKPDGKAQVTVQKGKIINVLVSTQHSKEVTEAELRSKLMSELIEPVLQKSGALKGSLQDSGIEVLTNPTGSFILGGFDADTGLTGRKIMVDTYGGLISHGGGCFSGKDPSKVDRSAAYFCRFVAKNLVHQGYAKECVVSVAYAIGRAEPLMVTAYDENGKTIDAEVLNKYDFKPAAIIEQLDLLRPIYQSTAVYGHFNNPEFPWEQLIKQ